MNGSCESTTLRVTRHFSNGERQEDLTGLEDLGGLIARRPGRAIALAWVPAPRTVLVVATPHSRPARAALPVVVSTLRSLGCERVLVESDDMAALVEKSGNREAPVARPDKVTLTPWREDIAGQGVREDVHVVICLGGDGLILHVVSALFPHAVPPIMPFNLGSLGFLTPFNLSEHESSISRILLGKNKTVTMRMRLRCVIVPKGRSLEGGGPACVSHCIDDDGVETPKRVDNVSEAMKSLGRERETKPACDLQRENSDCESARNALHPQVGRESGLLCYHVLNEIVIDRGPAPYLCNLEVLADDCPVTRVQADGLILATPTGSTAYNLSSGGSMVHPSVPAILFTPICPHSLSFRPVLFPHDTVLQVKIPEDARASAWVSFDGRHRMELMRGDKVVVWASQYPVPTFSAKDPTSDWFASVSHCLRWNERAQQASFFGESTDCEEPSQPDFRD